LEILLEQKLLGADLDDPLRRQMRAYEQRYDLQTGLLNYHVFQESLTTMLRERNAGREVALLWIDVLNLRREFALWGAKGTEARVAQVAEALRSVVDGNALLGRFSARCFLVALEAAKFNKADRRRIQSIADALAPLRAIGSHNKIETAAGVAFWPSDATSAEDLTRFASLAASRAGYLKSPLVQSFRAGMNHHILRDHQLEAEMRKGLESSIEACIDTSLEACADTSPDAGAGQDRQFGLVYQPKIEVATGQVLGAEALIRWNHPELGSVAPSEFIPVAERSELIQRIVEFALNTALKDVQQWQSMGLSLPLISVNMSWANLHREDFVPAVRARLAKIPISPTRLELEVTESVLMDDEELFAARVRQLKAIGVRVAIDDFGTRYTGFNVLKRIPLDSMKIDRCFIHGIDRSRDMRALCETIVAMARQLKLRTVAEGVEQPGELEVLRQIGCDAAQGYLFQRPVPAADLAEFLRSWPRQTESLGFALLGGQLAASALG
jgi:EAL domain-containing protein (putative c-di-GMP-specific phosphodiesterase class I)/GGDEF domain-containing protein